MNNRKKLIVMVIALSLILILSSSYAILRSTKVGQNDYVINVGDLKVVFNDGQTEKLSLTNIEPLSDEEGESQEDVLSFTIENTGTVGSYFDISIEELSTSPEFKSVIKYISNKDDGEYTEPKVLSDNKYIELTGYLESGATKTYKVKVWLVEEADNTYMGKTFKAKIALNAYQESNYAKDVIKSKLVKYSESSKEDFSGGLVAVNTAGELYNETDATQTIREYRYSGSNVNNYVTFNNETWRIIGIFTDETNASHIKIVKQNLLDTANLPQSYVIKNTTYKINSGNAKTVYWNYITGTESDLNDWTKAGLQYYLNTEKDENGTAGYLSKLSDISKKMIADTKYYLGNARFVKVAKIIYEDERQNSVCSAEVGASDAGDCFIWYGNKATWTGKIGLLYPSDWSYSANSKYWNTVSISSYSNEAKNSTWMYETLDSAKEVYTMFISPSTVNKNYIVNVRSGDGRAGAYYVYNNTTGTARPTLYLKSDVKIVSGDGSINNQYKLSID